jgi:hypothetical protein
MPRLARITFPSFLGTMPQACRVCCWGGHPHQDGGRIPDSIFVKGHPKGTGGFGRLDRMYLAFVPVVLDIDP